MIEIMTVILIGLFGIIASYTDIKYGIVKNTLIILTFLAGIIINFIEIIFFSYKHLYIILTNLLFSFLICFFLWFLRLLPGGDAKLIMAFSFLIPPSIYEYVYLKNFPSISLLMNIFIPPAFLLIILAFYYGGIKKIKKVLMEKFSLKRILEIFIFVVSVYESIKILMEKLGIPTTFFIVSTIIFLFYHFLRALNINRFKIYPLLFLINLFFVQSKILTSEYWLSAVFITLYICIITFLFYLCDETYSEEVKINELKPGMCLAEIIIKKDKENYYIKESFPLRLFIDLLYLTEKRIKDSIFYIDENTLEKLKTLQKKGLLKFDKIRVAKTIPFAPFITIGSLITVFLKGKFILIYLFQLF